MSEPVTAQAVCGTCTARNPHNAYVQTVTLVGRDALVYELGRASHSWRVASDAGDDVTAMLIWAEEIEPAESALAAFDSSGGSNGK